MTASAMGAIWDAAIQAVTSGLNSTITTITGSSVMLLSVAVPFIGACIGLAKRLLRFGGRK